MVQSEPKLVMACDVWLEIFPSLLGLRRRSSITLHDLPQLY